MVATAEACSRCRGPLFEADDGDARCLNCGSVVYQHESLDTPQRRLRTEPLSARQLEAVRLAAGGKTRRQIARAMGVGSDVAKHYLREARDRLYLTTREELTAWWRETGRHLETGA